MLNSTAFSESACIRYLSRGTSSLLIAALIGTLVSISATHGSELDTGWLQSKVQSAIQMSLPAVVGITQPNDRGDISGSFSGVIVSADGIILSAAHAVAPDGRYDVYLTDGRKVTARGLGSNRDLDCAMMRITDSGTWPHAELGRSDSLQVDQPVVSISYPGLFIPNRAPVVRFGKVLQKISSTAGMIQTTAMMEPGDSGGPLLDLEGRVIGIHSQIERELEKNFDVPIDNFRLHWDKLTQPSTFEITEIPGLLSPGIRPQRGRGGRGGGQRGGQPGGGPGRGIPGDGTPRGGAPGSGAPGSGAPRDGAPGISTPNNGTPSDGVPNVAPSIPGAPLEMPIAGELRGESPQGALPDPSNPSREIPSGNGVPSVGGPSDTPNATPPNSDAPRGGPRGGQGRGGNIRSGQVRGGFGRGEIIVDEVLPGSVAEKAGILVGDRILQVDGNRIGGQFSQFKRWIEIRGFEGERTFDVVVRRDNQEKHVVLNFPEPIIAPIVEKEKVVDASKDSPLVKLPQLSKTFADLESNLDELTALISSERGNESLFIVATRLKQPNLLISKSSFVAENPTVRLTNGTVLPANIVARDETNDLVLVRVSLPKGTGIDLNDATGDPLRNRVGSLLITPSPDSDGFISVIGTPLFASARTENKGRLGIYLKQEDNHVFIDQVMAGGSAAQRAGLRVGDKLLQIDKLEVSKLQDFIAYVGSKDPGQSIKLKYERDGQEFTKDIVLGSTYISRHVAEEFAGGKSKRRDGFTQVFAHDGTLQPSDCGGPIFDTDGHFLGINIARYSRTQSYAIPRSVLKDFVDTALKSK